MVVNWRSHATAFVGCVALSASAAADGQYALWIDVSGWADRSEAIIDLGGGKPAVVTGLQWDVTLTASGGGWLSDGWFGFGEPGQPSQLLLVPGADDPFPGTASYAGSVKFSDVNLPNLLLPEGLLRLQFLTSGWDVVVEPKSQVMVQYDIVPAPSGLGAAFIAALLVRRRRSVSRHPFG